MQVYLLFLGGPHKGKRNKDGPSFEYDLIFGQTGSHVPSPPTCQNAQGRADCRRNCGRRRRTAAEKLRAGDVDQKVKPGVVVMDSYAVLSKRPFLIAW